MNTVITSLLQTNDVASPSDATQIRRLWKEDIILLATVEEELAVLEQKRRALQASIGNYETILAPIRLLSTDILQYIFLLTLPDDRNPAMSSKESPLLVSQVCSTWRQAALTAPRLWSRLHIPLFRKSSGPIMLVSALPNRRRHDEGEEAEKEEEHNRLSNSDYNRYVVKFGSVMSNRRQIVEQWLVRAGMTDLSISVVEVTATSGTTSSNPFRFLGHKQRWTRHSADIVNILVNYASQLAVLDLDIPPEPVQPILGLPPSMVPRLRSLNLRHPSYYDDTSSNSKYTIVNSPNIRSLRIAISARATDATRMQWGDLTKLALTIPPGVDKENMRLLRELFSVCQNLVVLSVSISTTFREDMTHANGGPSHGSLNIDSIALPQLTTLLWNSRNSSSEHDALFQSLSLPSLRELKWAFAGSHDYTLSSNSAFVELLKQSGHNLRTMELTALECRSFRYLSRYMKLTPGIERLHLEIGHALAEGEMWEALSLPIADQTSTHEADFGDVNSSLKDTLDPPLPRLTVISCKCYAKNIAPLAVQQFIRSRRQDAHALAQLNSCKLQKIRISYYQDRYDFPPRSPSFAHLAQKHREERQREFLEELTTKLGVDIEGLQVEVEWPYFGSEDRLFSPLCGLPEFKSEDGQLGWDASQSFGLSPNNSLGIY
ncbi:hypothetical protein EST38_g8469 [Candolleomyces aberdarensis]|uniref:F-box domain-containing protein n=1 Tax=Candolleomyces aberdarensis TaxID=2316362 RepID=A0A4Q2DE81_9AGAR|nr:hypothetical protein EST38_g8469 [Candolleomyces aberdarensis]